LIAAAVFEEYEMDQKLVVDVELLASLLGAAYTTYMGHRGEADELYALGALEATANLTYLMASNGDNPELEAMSQQFASDALNRVAEIARAKGHKQTDQLTSSLARFRP
jgi:hypothetical protein